MAKKSIDELQGEVSAPKFNNLKKFIFGDENETSKPSGLLENLDAYTGAPSRSAIEKLQNDFTDVSGAAQAAYEQFGEKPTKAPSGMDLAKNMRLEGIPQIVAGTGLELITDPTNLVSGAVKMAAVPLVGLKALKAADVAGDVARGVKAVDAAADAVKAAKATEEVAQLARGSKAVDAIAALTGGVEKSKSAAQQITEARQAKAAMEAIEAAKAIENAKTQEKMASLLKEVAPEMLEQGPKLPVRPAFIGPGGVVNADSASQGVQLAKSVPSQFGRVIQLPDVLEVRRAARLNKKPFESVGKIFKPRK